MNYAQVACFSLAISVILGSIGAHAMKPHLSVEAFNSWDTAVKYQVYQSLGLLLLSVAGRVGGVKLTMHRWAMHLIAWGMICFCLSLYLRSSSPVTGINFAWLGPVAPMGGLLFVAGWLLAVFSMANRKAAQ